jgi:UDP-N-acetylglucosamine:LPS N-acetylglucosamine transferase
VAGIESFVKGESYAVRVVRAVEESHHLAAKLVAIYNWLLRHKQHWMKYYYWLINRFRPETREFFHSRCIGYVRNIVERWCPHIVVSVHPLTQHIFARVLKEIGWADRVPLVTVVTDPYYGFWKGWACDDVRLYLVATEDARRQLIDYGIAPERIKVSGMPVHPKFSFRATTPRGSHARRWAGSGKIHLCSSTPAGKAAATFRMIFSELVRGELDVQAIFLAGKNASSEDRG